MKQEKDFWFDVGPLHAIPQRPPCRRRVGGGEEGRVGYTARCQQGHVFSGALPG